MIELIAGPSSRPCACRLALASGDRKKRIALTLALEAALESTRAIRPWHRVASSQEAQRIARAGSTISESSAHTRFLRGTTHDLQGQWAPALECCQDAEGLFRERCKNAWWEIDQSASLSCGR